MPRLTALLFAMLAAILLFLCITTLTVRAETIALWLFDEQTGLYPSCLIGDAATNKCPLVLGRGGQIVAGKYGNALEPSEQPRIKLSLEGRFTGFERKPKPDPSRKMEPMDWANDNFCALMTRGEK